MGKMGLEEMKEEDTGRKCVFVSVVACGCIVTPVSMTGVALLGWSSFEFDTMQVNG